jgi:hypothetical protein
MKLHDVPRNTRVTMPDVGEFTFHHIDGMYSYCTDDAGNVLHPVAWAEVELVEEPHDS